MPFTFFALLIPILFILFLTIKSITKMSAIKEQVDAKFEQLTGIVTKVGADVTRIKEQINPDGLTAEEAQDVIAKLDAVISQITVIDDATPEPVVEPPVEETPETTE